MGSARMLRIAALVGAFVLLVSACGREGAPVASAPTETPRATPHPHVTPHPDPAGPPLQEDSPEGDLAVGCRNSTDPACGDFRFDPAIGSDSPVRIDVDISPRSPRPGEPVTFHLRASDADSRHVFPGSYSFSRAGPGENRVPPRERCPQAYGPWDPPPTGSGSAERTLSHTYTQPGIYVASFTFFSLSYEPDAHPWPASPPGDADGFCVDPLASSATRHLEITVR